MKKEVTKIRVDKILPSPYQPRKIFKKEDLTELAFSIKRNGLMQPIMVRPSRKESGFYELIAGERRLKAVKGLKYEEIECIIQNYDDRAAMRLTTIENIQREDLNPIEEARAYKHLKDFFKVTQEELSIMVSKSRTKIANTLRLLELPEEVLLMIENNEISSSFGRTLLGLKDKDLIYKWAIDENKRNLSVNKLEKVIKEFLNPKESSVNTSQKIKNNYFRGIIDRKSKKLSLTFEDDEKYNKLLIFIENLETS